MSGQPATSQPASSSYSPRYIDIGINLSDPIFRGHYHGKSRHPDDLDAVISRAREVGCTKLMVTGSDLQNSQDGLDLAAEYSGTVYATAGIHPCSSAMFAAENSSQSEPTTQSDPDPEAPVSEDLQPDPTRSAKIIAELTTLLAEARSSGQQHLVAFGEFGLDYDRLHYCNKNIQLHSFEAQLKVAASLEPQLPLFLHSRAAHRDFVGLLQDAFGPRLERLERGGVVHSFTGTIDEMRELMDLGLHIGINGCSFKTEDNCAVVKEVRLDRLMIETDGPWCEVRPSHEGWKYLLQKKDEAQQAASSADRAEGGVAAPPAETPKPAKKNQKKEPEIPERFKVVKKEKWVEGAMVKGRNEPCNIERVATIVAAIKGVTVQEVCEATWENTIKVFGMGETI